MTNNATLKAMVTQRFSNNDSREFILGYVCGIYVVGNITSKQYYDIKKYINDYKD